LASRRIDERLKPLSDEQRELLNNKIFNRGSANEILISKFNVDMTREKALCLKYGTWLNDEVINFYMKLLQERDDRRCQADCSRKASHFFLSFFITKLLDGSTGYNYDAVRRSVKNTTW
jgi:sentrin-specific protease 1